MYASTTVDRLDALLHQHAHGKGYSPEIFSAEGLVTTRLDPAVSGSARYEAGPEKSKADGWGTTLTEDARPWGQHDQPDDDAARRPP